MLDALQCKYQMRFAVDHNILPWFVRHAGDSLNRFQVGKDGRTAVQRLKGRRFARRVVEFGEGIWYLKPQTRTRGALSCETRKSLGLRYMVGDSGRIRCG